jgi:hypothetical protein
VSFDSGEHRTEAGVTPRHERGWQTFSIDWRPAAPGNYRLQCRATDIDGRAQPVSGARNAIYSVDIVVTADD